MRSYAVHYLRSRRSGLCSSSVVCDAHLELLQRLDLDPTISPEDVRAAIPSTLVPQYKEPWVAHQTRDFAIATQASLTEEARRNAITAMVMGMIIPPLVLLVLGAAIGRVLTGFRRKPQIAS